MIVATRPASTRYLKSGIYTTRTLDQYLAEAVEFIPDKIAVVDHNIRLNYAELTARVRQFATGMQALGVEKGDVVSIMLPNWWEAMVGFQALLSLGAVVNPIVPIYRDAEVSFIVQQARPKVIIAPHRFRNFDYTCMFERVRQNTGSDSRVVIVRPETTLPEGFLKYEDLVIGGNGLKTSTSGADDIVLLLYTSGTTAEPKGVLHSHQTLDYEIRSIAELCVLTEDDAVFMPSPVTHITGFLYGILMTPMLKTAVVLLDTWDPRAGMELIENYSCRFIVGATPFLQGLTDVYKAKGITSALRTFLCGGADVPPSLVYQAREALNATVARVYGSSEFPTFCSGGPNDDLRIAAETDGRPIGSAIARLDTTDGEVGELLLQGPDCFLGYLDPSLNGDAFTDDGYFRTGDLAKLENGTVTICGRKKDIIVRGGENISASQVEALLYRHEQVEQVAVVAMPDRTMGEKACAFIVPVKNSNPELNDISRFLEKQGIAKQKFPERVELVKELPMTASGKIQKFKLREQIKAILQTQQDNV